MGLRTAQSWHAPLQCEHLSAAVSLQGLDEMFAINRLGIDGRLGGTLISTNPVKGADPPIDLTLRVTSSDPEVFKIHASASRAMSSFG